MFFSLFCLGIIQPSLFCLLFRSGHVVVFSVLFGIKLMFCLAFCSGTGVLFRRSVLFGNFVLFGVLFAGWMFCSFSQVCAERRLCSANGVRG